MVGQIHQNLEECIKLTLIHSKDDDLNLIQTRWKSLIDPVLGNPLVDGHVLSNVILINGTTVVNHKLGRKLQGWFIVGLNGVASVYDKQATNQTQDLTLVLTSNAFVTANLYVF